METKELMRRYCGGDARAFRQLYTLISPRLFGYLVRISCDRALAEDLLQHAFMKVHRSRAAYVVGADPEPWIYAIAHRTFIDEVRKRKRDLLLPGDDRALEQTAGLGGSSDEDPYVPADSDLVSVALSALERLPHAQRQAVVLTKLEGRTLAEAAEIAGTSTTAMKVRAHRGYKALRVICAATIAGLVVPLTAARS